MNRLTDILTAMNQYIKQYHWLAKGYDNHILADKLGEKIDDSIDRLKELYLGSGGDGSIALASTSLAGAEIVVQKALEGQDNIEAETNNVLENIGYLIVDFLNTAKEVKQAYENTMFSGGINNAIDDISEMLIRNTYLLGIQAKK